MDRLVEHLFVFENEGKIRDFPGNYSDYREWKAEEGSGLSPSGLQPNTKSEVRETKYDTTSDNTPVSKRKPSFKEQKEFETLEKEIAKLTERKDKLTHQLNAGSDSYEDLTKWAKEIEAITDELDEKELRWLELSEFV
jgi:ATP-binding cassette subfamily F protein uup